MKAWNIISMISAVAVVGGAMNAAHGLAMSGQVRRLLQEKQEKIAQLEKCEGKKKGWMIAGISTIGLTAVGVVGNVVLAGKSNSLSEEITAGKEALRVNENELERVNDKIAGLVAKKGGNNRGGNKDGFVSGSVDASAGDIVEAFCVPSQFVVDSDNKMSGCSFTCSFNGKEYKLEENNQSSEYCSKEPMPANALCVVNCPDLVNPVTGTVQELYNIRVGNTGGVSEAVVIRTGNSGCEKYNHYELNVSDGYRFFYYMFEDFEDNPCSKFTQLSEQCIKQGGEWKYSYISSMEPYPYEYKCISKDSLWKYYDGPGFDDFVRQECDRYGGRPYRSNAFMYYCVGVRSDECNKIKTAFESAVFPDPITVSFDNKLNDAQTGAWTSFSGRQTEAVDWKNVCTIEAFGNAVEEYRYNPQ